MAYNPMEPTSKTLKIAPSILSANFGSLNADIAAVENAGADLLHIDIMDGHFVPNLTFGNLIVQQIQTQLPLDVHLMVENTSFFIEHFALCKPAYISFHIEKEPHVHRLIQQIRKLEIRPAIALNPHTPLNALEYILPDVDMILIMSVNPGFGGQSFLPLALDKIKALKERLLNKNPSCLIEVDGGVNANNIASLKEAGVDVVVAGSYIFGAKDYKQAIQSLKI